MVDGCFGSCMQESRSRICNIHHTAIRGNTHTITFIIICFSFPAASYFFIPHSYQLLFYDVDTSPRLYRSEHECRSCLLCCTRCRGCQVSQCWPSVSCQWTLWKHFLPHQDHVFTEVSFYIEAGTKES